MKNIYLDMIYEDLLSNSSGYVDFNLLKDKLSNKNVKFHLAIMRQPFMNNILNGSKTIESRFTKVKCAPYNRINNKDIIIFKESPGNIVAVASIKNVDFYSELDENDVIRLIQENSEALTADDNFIELKKNSKYITFVHLDEIISIPSIKLIGKNDMRGWVILNEKNTLF